MNVAEWLLDRARAGGGGKKDQRDDGNGTDVSPSHLGLCPRPGGSPSEQDRGLPTTRYLVSVCVVRRPSLSGDGIPASPLPGSRHWRQRVRPFGPGLAQTDTWCCCCCCVRSPAAAAAREETKRAAVQTPRKLCSPRRSLLWWCETVSVVSRSQCCVCAFWCEMTGRTRTTARTRQHYIPGQIDTVRPGQHHTAGSSEEGSDLIWCRPSCCATNPADQARPQTGRKHSPT